jgi:hypothetical protein
MVVFLDFHALSLTFLSAAGSDVSDYGLSTVIHVNMLDSDEL